jgi:copper chaperone
MEALKFKTTVKCGGCIQTVTPYLNKLNEIKIWNVDLTTPERTLTVEGENLDPSRIIYAMQQAGYKAELI